MPCGSRPSIAGVGPRDSSAPLAWDQLHPGILVSPCLGLECPLDLARSLDEVGGEGFRDDHIRQVQSISALSVRLQLDEPVPIRPDPRQTAQRLQSRAVRGLRVLDPGVNERRRVEPVEPVDFDDLTSRGPPPAKH